MILKKFNFSKFDIIDQSIAVLKCLKINGVENSHIKYMVMITNKLLQNNGIVAS